MSLTKIVNIQLRSNCRKDQEEDDRKRGRGRDRGSYGPTSSFTEKKDYKPTVNLEYIDDNGRAMNSKEAFRFLRCGVFDLGCEEESICITFLKCWPVKNYFSSSATSSMEKAVAN